MRGGLLRVTILLSTSLMSHAQELGIGQTYENGAPVIWKLVNQLPEKRGEVLVGTISLGSSNVLRQRNEMPGMSV
jgi:hypothetical protein